MAKVTITQLLAEIEALKRRVAELEARPPVVLYPLQPITPVMPWRPGEVWCGTVVADAFMPPLWNGPRNPDGTCAPIGMATITLAHGGGSGG